MKYFQNLTTKIAVCLLGICAWNQSLYSYNEGFSELGIDGLGNSVAVWRVIEEDPINGDAYKVQGAYTSGATWGTAVDISEISEGDASDYPILAVSKDPSALVLAATVWLNTISIPTDSTNIVVSLFDGTDWSANPEPLSNQSSFVEEVQDDYLIAISDDGQTISVTWSSYLPNATPPQYALRSAITVDGGNNWTKNGIIALTGDSP